MFAADSKLTTMGLAGFEQDGSPRWVDQTYDNASKVVHDAGTNLMAMVAGHANIGRVSATDFISRSFFAPYGDIAGQDQGLSEFVNSMVQEKQSYWSDSQVPEGQWPGPTIILASPAPGRGFPRVWRVNFEGPASQMQEILNNPGLRLEGSYDEAFTLLYGFNPSVLSGVANQIGVEPQRIIEAVGHPRGWLWPVEQINFWAMPLQDAIDFAVFVANVQVEMDRFLPGPPACGGPIDVMVLRMTPEPQIVVFPGKELHHPKTPGLG